mgnify:FL=1
MQKTDFNFEVLIHDDASTDGTEEIIRDYASRYPEIIRPVYEIENQYVNGVIGSEVFNFPRSRGKYIAMCEGDDYWTDPDKLQSQVDFLEKNEHCAACFTNAEIKNEFNNSGRRYLNGLNEGYIAAETSILRGGALYPTASIVFRRYPDFFGVFKEIRELNSDNLLIMLLAMRGDVYYINKITCTYRVWEGGIYSSVMDDVSKTLERKRKSITGLIKLEKMSKKPYRQYVKKRISDESLYILKNGGFFRNFSYLSNLNVKDAVKLLIY